MKNLTKEKRIGRNHFHVENGVTSNQIVFTSVKVKQNFGKHRLVSNKEKSQI